jgi:hypothetical protein
VLGYLWTSIVDAHMFTNNYGISAYEEKSNAIKKLFTTGRTAER